MLVALGAHIIQADTIAHELMQPGTRVYEEVVRHFGSGILNPDGRVNRARLAEAAFGPPGAKQTSRIDELNRIVHPAVIQRQNGWMEEVGRTNPHAIAIVEAALILEAGAASDFDRLLVVTCQPEQRIARWAAKMKINLDAARGEISRRMAAQLPDEQKIKAADYVIDNSGSLDQTRNQVKVVYGKLRAEGERS